MHTRHSLATIGLFAAVFGAAISPGSANEWDDFGCAVLANCTYHAEPPGTIHTTLDHPIPMGKTKKQKQEEADAKAAKYQKYLADQQRSLKTQEALKKLNALGGGPKKSANRSLDNQPPPPKVVGVVSGRGLNGNTSTFRNTDWTKAGHGNTTTTGMKTLTANTPPKPMEQPKPATSAPTGAWGGRR